MLLRRAAVRKLCSSIAVPLLLGSADDDSFEFLHHGGLVFAHNCVRSVVLREALEVGGIARFGDMCSSQPQQDQAISAAVGQEE